MEESVWEESITVNPAQAMYQLMRARHKYIIWSRGTGKSYIVGAEVDENVRMMPRGVTTMAQATYGQALTKTLPSTFKMLETLGYKRYDPKTKSGDYVVCRTPPDGWFRPYEHILSYEHCITFSNGHCLYILTQDGNSRGPSADYNITDEAQTLDKEQFDQEVAPTNRGNEDKFGRLSRCPVYKHHGNTFLSSMPYEPEQKWLLEPAKYYEQERGVQLFDVWNKVVKLYLVLIDAKMQGDLQLFREVWNECIRLRRTITPFVSSDGTLFVLASIFDNIANVGMQYIINQYKVMEKLSFMIEILNYVIDRVDNCYYKIDERHKYYNATNDHFIRDFAEDTEYSWQQLAQLDSRFDLDCNPNKPLEICFDWGSAASFMEVAQPSDYDFVNKYTVIGRTVDNTINEFFVRRDDEDDTEINALIDKFCHYYRHHPCKVVRFYRDRYGDARRANSKRTYNQIAVARLEKQGWTVEQFTHRGMEPPQHDKFLLWSQILAETDIRFPLKRFNATKCKYILISMNNTRVRQRDGKFEKDKRAERNDSVLPEEATHFGDVVDKRIWTKYGDLLKDSISFVPARF
ncbi:MAG: hypothetical protein IJV06_09930 [Bacteroidaceae bacterium]|nr:hypothetical protein [Bacteroidaceae bacterium]